MKSSRHRALVVESDPSFAADFGELLDALGYASVLAESFQDAIRIAEGERFCFGVMALDLKARPSSRTSHLDVGRRLLRALRKRFPDRVKNGHHRLPLMVLSRHCRSQSETLRLMKYGADDVLVKPINDNEPILSDRLESALKDAGRSNHDACCDAAGADSDSTPPRLVIDTTARRVIYRGHEIATRKSTRGAHLQPQPFAALVHLASKPGEAVTSIELSEVLERQGLLSSNLGADLKRLRSRILRAFRECLADTDIDQAELAGLISTLRGQDRIVLSVSGRVEVRG